MAWEYQDDKKSDDYLWCEDATDILKDALREVVDLYATDLHSRTSDSELLAGVHLSIWQLLASDEIVASDRNYCDCHDTKAYRAAQIERSNAGLEPAPGPRSWYRGFDPADVNFVWCDAAKDIVTAALREIIAMFMKPEDDFGLGRRPSDYDLLFGVWDAMWSLVQQEVDCGKNGCFYTHRVEAVA